jgi:GNAT superfamily N-acetyltransferase
MNNGFRIEYLADYPEHADACAAWTYGRWSVQKKGRTLEYVLGLFKAGAQKDKLPLTLVVLNDENDMPVAMASLWEKDGTIWTDDAITPWVACVYTHYRYRGRGFAKALLSRLEEELKRLGFDHVYLQSGSAASLYIEAGYDEVETVKSEETKAGTQTLFKKTF